MSAFEPSLMLMLLEAEPATPAEKALWRVIALYCNNDRMTCNELRVFEIAMEGLGFPPARRLLEIQKAIQRKRDRWLLMHPALEGGTDAPP